MPRSIQGPVTVVGRILLALIFLASALGNDIPNFSQVAQFMGTKGIPAPQLLLAGAIVFLLAGSVSLIVGYQARIGAALLLVFLVLATYYFHNFWAVPADTLWVLSSNPDVKMPVAQVETINFMKNVGLMGAMLLVIANGAGPMSLDERLARGKA